VVLFDFANQSEAQQVAAATQPLYWTYKIHLSATDKLYWQPPDANIEFSADLTLEQTRDGLYIAGDMSALRGTYYYLNNKYTINRSNLTFDSGGGVDPKLDVEAVTEVSRDLGPPGGQPGGKEAITVTITGRAREPVITFVTDSGWDQPTVLRALTFGQFGTGQRDAGTKNFADSYFTRAINRQLSSDLSRAFQGYINDLELERESGGLLDAGKGDVIVRVGVPLSSRVTLRAGQALPGTGRTASVPASPTTNPFERDIEAEYRINRFIYITSGVTQRRPSTTTVAPGAPGSTDFNVNLKARWEY
jgi:hypothetical protein